ncbi:MAG: DUF4303 domain-containing protein [Fimbriimonadaceae bacterium]|nr:DUF4303 domain-containing protein [Fimbriimonadaceae bacterium]
MQNASELNLPAIAAALAADGTAWYQALQPKLRGERVYAFLFELSAVGYAAAAAVATEEGLRRTAEGYLDDFDGDLTRAIASLRWAGPEDGWYQSPERAFRTTNRLLDAAERQELYPVYSGDLERLALQALQQMDATGLFGTGAAREQVTLGVCHTGGDQPAELWLSWLSAVNPPAVVARVRAELAAT